jgi:hypothetical protein
MMMSLSCGLGLEQRLVHKPHSPIENPELTEEAEDHESDMERVLSKGKLSPYEKMLHVESALLSNWEFGDDWRTYLDSPLLAHVDAALRLKKDYDAVVGIEEAGIPYAKIFEMVGFPIYEIDFSHHKRDMETPEIDESQLNSLKDGRVLLADIDFVSGKTLREVHKFLKGKGINVDGAYIGLSQWPGMDSEEFGISENTVDFDTFWKGKTTGLSEIRSSIPYKRCLIPEDFMLFSSNPTLPEKENYGSVAARRIARYFINRE